MIIKSPGDVAVRDVYPVFTRGNRREGTAAVDLKGGIACRTVDLDGLTQGSTPGHVLYDDRLDPTRASATTYKMYMSNDRLTSLNTQ